MWVITYHGLEALDCISISSITRALLHTLESQRTSAG